MVLCPGSGVGILWVDGWMDMVYFNVLWYGTGKKSILFTTFDAVAA